MPSCAWALVTASRACCSSSRTNQVGIAQRHTAVVVALCFREGDFLHLEYSPGNLPAVNHQLVGLVRSSQCSFGFFKRLASICRVESDQHVAFFTKSALSARLCYAARHLRHNYLIPPTYVSSVSSEATQYQKPIIPIATAVIIKSKVRRRRDAYVCPSLPVAAGFESPHLRSSLTIFLTNRAELSTCSPKG